jgi:probable phosphoglycerate mutase
MFVIVRHGNTFAAGEVPRRIGARTDLPLTDKGHEQARALGALFAANGWRFGRILVSPLLRALQTAEAIQSAQPSFLPQETADFLREIDHGPDENRTEEEVLARIGADALAAWDARALAPPGWRVDADLRIAAWRALFDEHREEDAPVLLVTSNGAARFALMAEPGLQMAASRMRSLKLPTGGYGVVRRVSHGTFDIPAWGRRP